MDHKEKALNYFSQQLHCSQAVLAAFAEECGITEEQALKLGSCFGGGMRKGEVELNPIFWTVFMLPVFHYELQQVSDN